MVLQRTFLTGLAVTVLVVQACGSDDGKKRTQHAGDAGMGGEAGAGLSPDSGGSSAGEPPGSAGEPSGSAGEPSSAGAGGSGEEPIGGSGGQPPTPPDPELLFVVRDDAIGLADTAVSTQTYKQNAIYTTRSAVPDAVDGHNEVKVVGEDLGLADADWIMAFAELQPEPESPQYLFSVVEGSEGATPTTVNDQYWDGEPAGGDVFFSDASESFRYWGEGGDQYGYNGLAFSEVSLGLSPGVFDETTPDELRDLLARDANQPLSELYFTVNADSVGAPDSAVEAAGSDERGCTVFKSELDGTNTVAFSCSALGLVAGDQIDALVVYGADAPEKLVFSVSYLSQGAVDSAVAEAVANVADPGGTLFQSTGDGANSLAVSPRALGLGYDYAEDEIDGLTVLDVPVGSVNGGLSCTASFDPFDAAQGDLISNTDVIGIGQEVAVLLGRKSNQVTSVVAFDVATCAFLQQKDLTDVIELSSGTAIVRLANWMKATPLDNVAYFQAVANANDQLVLQRYDASGAAGADYVFTNLSAYDSVHALTHDLANNQLYLVTGDPYYWRLRLSVLPVPNATVTELTADLLPVAMPCTNEPNYVGTDSAGNLILTQTQADGASLRVCKYTAGGRLLPSPYTWTPQTMPQETGFIANGSHVSVTTGSEAGPVSIERGTYRLP